MLLFQSSPLSPTVCPYVLRVQSLCPSTTPCEPRGPGTSSSTDIVIHCCPLQQMSPTKMLSCSSERSEKPYGRITHLVSTRNTDKGNLPFIHLPIYVSFTHTPIRVVLLLLSSCPSPLPSTHPSMESLTLSSSLPPIHPYISTYASFLTPSLSPSSYLLVYCSLSQLDIS